MNPIIAETIYVDFITSAPTTGAATDADAMPTAEVFEDATDTAILSPTVVKRSGKTGNYRVPIACTGANGFEVGKSYNVVVSATVGAVAAKAVAQTFQVRDVAVGGDASQATLLAVKAKTDNLPVDPADASDIATSFAGVNTKLDTMATYVDTEVAAIKAKTDNLPASPAATGDAMSLTTGERTSIAVTIWDRLTSALTTIGSIGKLIVDNLNATVASRSTYAGADTSGTTTLLSRIASALTITSGKVDVNDKTGFGLTSVYDPAKTAAQAGAAMTLTAVYDPAKTASQSGDAMTLTSAYDSAKTAASQTSVTAIRNVTDKLDGTLELDGPVYRYTINALEMAPVGEGGGGGVADWTPVEREQIRSRLGIDGTASEPLRLPTLAIQTSLSDVDAKIDLMQIVTDKLHTTLESDGNVFRFTKNALEMAPAGDGAPIPPGPSLESPCAQNPARTLGPTTEPLMATATAQSFRLKLNRR